MTTIPSPWSIALNGAAERPDAMVGCPGCGAEVKGRNLGDHQRRLHPDLGAGSSRVTVTADALVVRRRLGVGRRRVALPAPVEVGPLVRRVTDAAFGTTAMSDSPNPTHDERAGTYLRVGRVTIGCTGGTKLKAHWSGWQQGTTRRRAHVKLSPADFVALQHSLSAAGVLRAGGR